MCLQNTQMMQEFLYTVTGGGNVARIWILCQFKVTIIVFIFYIIPYFLNNEWFIMANKCIMFLVQIWYDYSIFFNK